MKVFQGKCTSFILLHPQLHTGLTIQPTVLVEMEMEHLWISRTKVILDLFADPKLYKSSLGELTHYICSIHRRKKSGAMGLQPHIISEYSIEF